MGQVLVNPSTINVSPWFTGGTGASATSATTFQTSASTSASLAQSITVTPGTTYTATVTIRGASATGYCTLAIYATNYSTSYGSQTISLTTSNQVMSFSSVIPAGVTGAVFEMDFDSTSGIVVTVTGASYSNGSAFTRTSTDSITLVSTLGRVVGKKANDSVTMGDSLQSTRARIAAFVDSLTIADTLQSTRIRLLALLDALNPLDTMSRASARVLVDLGTLTESISRMMTRSAFDSVALADTLASARNRLLALLDALTLTDSIQSARVRLLAFLDALNPVDSLQFARVRLLAFLDTFALADSIRRLSLRTAADTLPIIDNSPARFLSRAPLTDSLPVVDWIATSRARALAFFDAIVPLDSVSRFLATVRADALNLADALVKALSLPIASSLGTIQIFRVKAETRHWTISAARRSWTVATAGRKWILTEQNIMISTSKDPLAAEDFQLDWTAELGSTDSIASSAWSIVVPASSTNPLTAASAAGSITGKTTQVRLSGGTIGKTYLVTNTVVLASGQTKARSLNITIERL